MARTSLINMMLFGALVAGLALLVVADSDDDDFHFSECTKNWLENKSRFMPHENDCTKYYVCLGSRKLLRQCQNIDDNGNRYFFNDKLHRCDLPEHVDCHLSLPPKMNQLTLKKELLGCNPPAPTKCPRTDPKDTTIHLAVEGDCTKFYKCLQGSQIKMSCPTDREGRSLFFNPCKQVCDWRFNVYCPPKLSVRKELVGRRMSDELHFNPEHTVDAIH